MFTAHEILDIAIQLENNGEKTYLDAITHASKTELKYLLNWIAQEERNNLNRSSLKSTSILPSFASCCEKS